MREESRREKTVSHVFYRKSTVGFVASINNNVSKYALPSPSFPLPYPLPSSLLPLLPFPLVLTPFTRFYSRVSEIPFKSQIVAGKLGSFVKDACDAFRRVNNDKYPSTILVYRGIHPSTPLSPLPSPLSPLPSPLSPLPSPLMLFFLFFFFLQFRWSRRGSDESRGMCCGDVRRCEEM